MTETELSEALQAAARAGDAKAKEFLRMWYGKQADRKVSKDSEQAEAPTAY